MINLVAAADPDATVFAAAVCQMKTVHHQKQKE